MRDFGKPEPEVILTEILPDPVRLLAADIDFPANALSPKSRAAMTLADRISAWTLICWAWSSR